MKALLPRIVLLLVVCAALCIALVTGSNASFVQTQRAQRAVTIIVNVSPSPTPGLLVFTGGSPTRGIAVSMLRRGRGADAFADVLDAPDEALNAPILIEQTANERSVRVEAEVSPDPNATLLQTNSQQVILNGVVGTQVKQSCAYTVTVTTTQSSWTLDHGLSNDFASAFPGSDLANNTYLTPGSPNPTSTPFVVFPDNSNQFAVLSKTGLNKSYCVDLTVTIPANVPSGEYSTNAIYTLFF